MKPQPLWRQIVGHVLIVTLTALQLQNVAYAAPIADPTGNVGFAPNIQIGPQGVPVINITAPNSHGVSLNTYGRFDVDAIGVILNNSLTGGGSLLGGQISANPNFNGRTAGIVVNEVIGASRSQLQGDIELFGAPAWVVIVNPNGISCNGCGATNIPQLTLSTGALGWRDTAGQSTSPMDASSFVFDVNQGDIAVGALGVEGTGSRIDLVAPHVTVNGAVRGGEQLNVIAGQQTVDAASLHTSNAANPSTTAPQFLIDASALGAMTAGSISLMVNGDGAGVRSLAPIAAQSQNLVIQADGSLQLASSFAQGQIDITSHHGGVTLDSTTGLAAVNIDAEGTVSTRGPLEAGGDLTVTSHTSTAQLSGNTLAVNNLTVSAPGIILSGNTASGQQTLLTGSQIHIEQPLTAIGGASIHGNQVDVQAEIATRDGLGITAQQLTLGHSGNGASIIGNLDAVSGDIRADGGLTVTGSASLSSGHDLSISNVITGGNLHLSAQHDLTTGSINSGGTVALNAGHQLTLNSAIYGNSVYLTAPLLDLVHAITAVQNIGLTSDTLNVATSLTAGGTINANVQSDAVFDGEIYAGNGLSMQTGGLLQFNQNVVAGGHSTLNAGSDLIAQAGLHAMDLNAVAGHDLRFAQDLLSGGAVTLQAANDLSIQGNTIASQSLTASAGNQLLFAGTVDAGALNATGPQVQFDGDVSALHDATVAAGAVTLPNRFVAGSSAHLSTTSGSIVSLGQLAANEDLFIESAQGITLAESGAGRNAQLIAHNGAISISHDFAAGNHATFTGSGDIDTAVLNAGGNLTASAAGHLSADRIAVNDLIDLNAGNTITVQQSVDAGNDITLVAGNNISIDGSLSSAGRLDAVAANTLHVGGDTGANDGIALTAQSGDIDIGGSLRTNGALTAEAAQSLHVTGNVETLQALTLLAGNDLTVGGDTTAADGARITAATGSVALAGNLGSGADLTITAAQNLSTGDLLVDGDTSLTATAGDLYTGALSTNGEANLVTGNDIKISGVLEVTNNAALTAGNNVTTLADVLIGGDYQVDLGGNLIHGGGTLILGNADIASGGSQAYRGDLLVAHELDIAAGNGLVVAGNLLGVDRVSADAGIGDALITGDTYSGTTLDIAADGDIAIGGFAQGKGITLESRNAGVYIVDSAMSEGPLTVQAQDDIFFGGTVGTSGDVSGVSDSGSITFDNGLITLADVSLHAHQDLVFDGETSLGGAVDLKADTGTLKNLGSMLLAQPATIDITGSFANDGSLIVNGDFNLNARNISVNGSLIALGGITAAAQNAITTGSGNLVNAANNIALSAQQTSIGGTLAAGEALTVAGSFGNSGLTVSGDSIAISGGSFSNSGTLYAPEVTITGSSGNDVSISGSLANSGTVAGGTVSLTGGAVTNTLSESARCRPDLGEPCDANNPAHHIYAQNPATIAASGSLNISGASLANEGIIQAGGGLIVNVSGAITNTRSINDPYNESNWNEEDADQKSPGTGIMVGGGGMSLSGGSITNQGGVIQSGSGLSMTASGAISSVNNGSVDVAPIIVTQNALTMSGGSITLDGTTLSTGGSATFNANSGSFTNYGIAGAKQNLAVTAAGNAINTSALLADGTVSISGQGISNSGVIYQFSPAPETPADSEPAPAGPNTITLNAGSGMLWNSGSMVARNAVNIHAGAYGAMGSSQIASYGDINFTIPGFVGSGALMSTLHATNTLNLNIAGVTVGVGDQWISGAQTVNLGSLTNYGNVFLAGKLNGSAANRVSLDTGHAASLPASYIGGSCPQSGPNITCELVGYETIATRGQLIVQGGISGTLTNEAAAYTAPGSYYEHVPELVVTWKITDTYAGTETLETVISKDNLPAHLPFLAVPGTATVDLLSPIAGYVIGEDLTLTGGDVIIAPLDNTHGQAAIANAQNASGGSAQNPDLGGHQTVGGAVIIDRGTYPGQNVAPSGASGFASLDEAMIAAGLAGNTPPALSVHAATGSAFYQDVYAPDFFRVPEPRQPSDGEVADPWEFPTGWSNPGDLPGGTVAAQQLTIDVNSLTNYGSILTFVPQPEDGTAAAYAGDMAILTQNGLFNYGTIYAAGDLDITGSVYNFRPFAYDENGHIVLEVVRTDWGDNPPDYLRDQCRADHGHCITVEERVPGPAAMIGAGGDLSIHGDVFNTASTIASGGNLAIDGNLTNESIVLETKWESHWKEWRGRLRGYKGHNEHGADYSRVAQGVVSAGQDLETGLTLNTGVIIAGTPPDPEVEGSGISGNITIHGGHTGSTDPDKPTPVQVNPAHPGEDSMPVMPGAIYATGNVTIDGGEANHFGNTGAVIAGGTITFDTSNGPLTIDTGTRTVHLSGETQQTVFTDSNHWYTASGDQKQPGGAWMAENYQYDKDDLTIHCKDCSFQVSDGQGNAGDNAFMAQLAQELGEAWSFEAIQEAWNVQGYQASSWRTSGFMQIAMVVVAIVVSILCVGSCAPAMLVAVVGQTVATAIGVAVITSVLNAIIMGKFDLRQFLQSVAIAAVTSGIMEGTGMADWGYEIVNDGGMVTNEAGVAIDIITTTTRGVADWGMVALGALGQGAMAAAISELTNGNSGQAFLMAFAMSVARAVTAEMRTNQLHSSAESSVFCEGDVCRPNFTVDPNTGSVQLGGERIDPGQLCSGQRDCSVIGFDADGNRFLITGDASDAIAIGEDQYSEIVRFEYNGGTNRETNLPVSLEQALNGGRFGGSQASNIGQFLFSGLTYDKTRAGLWDRFANTVVEAFSGVHDFLNDKLGFGYGPTGLSSQSSGWWTEFMNYANVGLSSPLALNNLVSPELQPWLQDYYDSLRKGK